jgi:hypothetical protein
VGEEVPAQHQLERGAGRAQVRQRPLPAHARVLRPLLAVLHELELVELSLERRSCRVRDGIRADLTGSSTYRASGERLASSNGRGGGVASARTRA